MGMNLLFLFSRRAQKTDQPLFVQIHKGSIFLEAHYELLCFVTIMLALRSLVGSWNAISLSNMKNVYIYPYYIIP